MTRKIILAGIAAILPMGLQAQGRGGVSAFHSAAVPPRVVVTGPVAGPPAVASPGTRVVVRSSAPRPRVPMPVRRSNVRVTTTRGHIRENEFGMRPGCTSAPGLGFDAAHQVAVCGTTTVGSRGLGQVPLFFPFFDGGFFLPGSSAAAAEESASAEAAPQQQPPVVVLETRERNRHSSTVAQGQTAPATEAAPAAPSDNDEFVFVRRDGRVFFAVAYSWERGTLRYVTSEGLRQTVSQDALDLDATRQFNEQRGLNFHLPA